MWQLYPLLARGSREGLDVWQFYGPQSPLRPASTLGKTLRWVIPGSLLLPNDRAATLQSGSPPAPGFATRLHGSINQVTKPAFSRTRTRTITKSQVRKCPSPRRNSQPITESANSLNIPGAVAKFISKPAHMGIYGPGVDYRVIAPDIA